MQQQKIKNSLNANEFPIQLEINTKPSLTVPDQTMTVREIMERYARGLPIGGSRLPSYDEEDDMPDIKTLDLTEREEYADLFRDELEVINKKRSKKQVKETVKPDENIVSDESSSNAGGSEG